MGPKDLAMAGALAVVLMASISLRGLHGAGKLLGTALSVVLGLSLALQPSLRKAMGTAWSPAFKGAAALTLARWWRAVCGARARNVNRGAFACLTDGSNSCRGCNACLARR